MSIKEKIIKKLERDVEPTAGHIELEKVTEEERNNLFLKFGEGNKDLTNFLKTSYNHNAPSMFCCSGHGYRCAYVVLKVNDNNIELLRKVGKVLSNYNVSTNFTDDHINGIIVTYRAHDTFSTDWLSMASQIMNNPELFNDSNPSIYYHEKIWPSYKPFLFDFKKKLLKRLRGEKIALSERKYFL